MTRRFGFECELSGGAGAALASLAEKGLAPGPGYHAYHCGCGTCDYDSEYLFRGQNDCTVDGELITKILTYGTPEADTAFRELAHTLATTRAYVETNAGFHVHVDRGDYSNSATTRLYRMFARYQDDLAELASTKFNKVRDYNSPMHDRDKEHVFTKRLGDVVRVGGSWLVMKPQTFEFRLWNATRVEWRMRLAVGVSVAMVNAAKERETRVRPDDPRTLEQVLEPWLDADTWAGILRQRLHKGGRAA